MKPRVFVSSVMEGFKDNRDAVRAAIIVAGGEAVLIEDQSGLPHSPRNACLDAVASSDILVIVVGERGGFTAPSGKLVIEEEYEEAQKRKLPILVFIQSVVRDTAAENFVKKASDYVEGFYRKAFNGPNDLKEVAETALRSVIKSWGRLKVDLSMIEENLSQAISHGQREPTLKFVLCPERVDEFVDPVTLEDEKFKDELLEIGHSAKVKLFSYEESKSSKVEIDKIVISQGDQHRGMSYMVHLEITTNGLIVIEAHTSTPEKDAYTSYTSMVVLESDVATVLKKCFAFAGAFFQAKDKFRRYERLHYNVSLNGMGYRKLVKAVPTGGVSMSMRSDAPVKAFDVPRLLVRADLLAPEKEIETALVICRRRLKD